MTDLHSLDDALAQLLENRVPLGAEEISLGDCEGRYLAVDICAHHDSPRFNASAMDGYALRSADAGQVVTVSQRVAAGSVPTPLGRGEGARIFTGAPLPEGADCVVMQENITERSGKIHLPAHLAMGDNVRLKGREVRTGDVLIKAGQRITPAAIGILASQGLDRVAVRKRPRIALLATGDELTPPGQPLPPGCIYDSNRWTLAALLRQFGAEIVINRHLPDRLDATRQALVDAGQQTDVVITSGGVSVGEEDHVRPAVESLGRIDLWKLDIRPGKPLALGMLRREDGTEVRVVGLAGNPVSSYVGTWLLIRPLIGALLGSHELGELPWVWARAEFSEQTKGRWHYMRARIAGQNDEGIPLAQAYKDQDSSLLRSCLNADALAVVPPHTCIKPGDWVKCLRLV